MYKYFLFLTILLFGCVNTRNSLVAESEESARVAVFKYAFNSYAESIKNMELGYFFIEVENHEPSVHFLNNFTNHNPKVTGISHSKIECGDFSGSNNEVTHKFDGKAGVIVSLHQMQKISDTKYEVSFSSVRNCLGGGGFMGIVEFENGVWVVKQIENTWVS
jgi:hypothetical protein